MRVSSSLVLTALATALAACGGSSSGTASDDGGGTDSGVFVIPGLDAAVGSDALISALDAPSGLPGPDSAVLGPDSSIPGLDATTGPDASAADAPASGPDSASGPDAAEGPDATTSKDAASGPEASAADAAPKDAAMEAATVSKDAAMEAATVNCSGTAPTGGTKECSDGSGTVNGNSWTLWQSGSGGCMTPYGVGAAFGATWGPNSNDFLAREGLQWNSSQSYTALGTITATFSEAKTGSAGGYSYIGIYGWSENPLHEYYIVEDWYGAGPPNPGGTLMGTITVDDGTYNVYTHTQTNQPAITGGNATFVQFFSVRQTARQCGTISISQHFSKWAGMGMTLGDMEEAKLLIEAGGGTGTVTFATGTVTATAN